MDVSTGEILHKNTIASSLRDKTLLSEGRNMYGHVIEDENTMYQKKNKVQFESPTEEEEELNIVSDFLQQRPLSDYYSSSESPQSPIATGWTINSTDSNPGPVITGLTLNSIDRISSFGLSPVQKSNLRYYNMGTMSSSEISPRSPNKNFNNNFMGTISSSEISPRSPNKNFNNNFMGIISSSEISPRSPNKNLNNNFFHSSSSATPRSQQNVGSPNMIYYKSQKKDMDFQHYMSDSSYSTSKPSGTIYSDARMYDSGYDHDDRAKLTTNPFFSSTSYR